MQRRNQDALIRIRTAVVNQEQALAEQMAQRKAYKPEDEHMALYQEDFKGAGGFAGADAKKRRGVSLEPDPHLPYPFLPAPAQFLLAELLISRLSPGTPWLTRCRTPHSPSFGTVNG